MRTNGNDKGWVALLLATLTDAEKRCLVIIEQLGSNITGAPFTTIDPDTFAELEAREFLEGYRERPVDPMVYNLTDAGRLWLKRCAERTGKYLLADEFTALFNSLDMATKRQFAQFAAMQIGMELHPEADEIELSDG